MIRWIIKTVLSHLDHCSIGGQQLPNTQDVGLPLNTTTTVVTEDKILVDLYYEVLCPDSRSFVLYQLYPAWQTLSQIFTLNLVPYGKAYVM